jgi:thiamine-phosphate pyrophosphorylase
MAEAALAAAPPDMVALQLREKDLEARELVEMARELRVICDRHHARLLVNDRLDVAIASRADGVHLPANSFAVADARASIGQGRLVGVSTHDHAEVIVASRADADFVVYGPVFDPLSKGAYTAARGADGLIAACSAASIPVFALGGITANRLRELRAQIAITKAENAIAHPAGVAVIGAIFGSPDPAAAMRDLIDALTP